MRLQSIHRQALVIFSIISFLWCIQKASEALAFVEEGVEDMHVKSYLEKPQGHIDEVFLRKRSDVEVEEHESDQEEIADIYISISTETFDIENIKYEKTLATVRFRYIL